MQVSTFILTKKLIKVNKIDFVTFYEFFSYNLPYHTLWVLSGSHICQKAFFKHALANSLNTSQSNLSNKLKRNNFSEKKLNQIADILNCDFKGISSHYFRKGGVCDVVFIKKFYRTCHFGYCHSIKCLFLWPYPIGFCNSGVSILPHLVYRKHNIFQFVICATIPLKSHISIYRYSSRPLPSTAL